MAYVDFTATYDRTGGLHASERVSTPLESKGRRYTLSVVRAYATAIIAAAGVAIITVDNSGLVVWMSTGFVALGLFLEFVSLQSYERMRSLRPAGHLISLAGSALLLSTVFAWLRPEEVRGAFFVVAAACAVVSGSVIVRRFTHARPSTLLVGDCAGVGQFVSQWGSRTDIEMRGICLAGDEMETLREIGGIPVLGTLDDVADVAVELAVDEVVVVPGPELTAYDVRRLSWALEGSFIELSVAAEVDGAVPHRIQPRVLGHRLLLSVRPGKRSRLAGWIKGAIDRVGAVFLLLLFVPVFLTVAIVIRRDSLGPVFFRQTRVGLDGRSFTMYKFRTMVVAAEPLLAGLAADNEGFGPLFKMANDPRVTRAGKHLRCTSLDELPQLVNVVKGDMSLIGPRPSLPKESETYDEWVRRRLRVKPGMTGAWQVSGRSKLSWQDSVRLDIDYVDNWTLRGDFTIAVKTARAVITRDGAA